MFYWQQNMDIIVFDENSKIFIEGHCPAKKSSETWRHIIWENV